MLRSPGRALVLGVVMLSSTLVGCATRAASIRYAPPEESRFPIDRDTGVEIVRGAVAELGGIVDNVQVLEEYTIVTTSRLSKDSLAEGALECRQNWRGIFSGGWVEESGAITVTVQLRDAGSGIAVTIREAGTDGCVPSGAVGDEIRAAFQGAGG